MKYKLIHTHTGEIHHCDKVVIDGFDYYVSNEEIKQGDYVIEDIGGVVYGPIDRESIVENPKLIIATNNLNIDIPKVVDEVEKLAWDVILNKSNILESEQQIAFTAWYDGYCKSQETHPFSEEDMIEFNVWQKSLLGSKNDNWLVEKSDKELIQLWKKQQPKIVYYA